MRFWKKFKALSFDNPVALKELRIGLRERRIFILQVLFLIFLLGLSLIVLPEIFQHKSSERLSESGKEFFYVLYWAQLLILLFTVPAFTCGSLSGERERHSLDMVLASRLSSGELVAGKLGFAVYCLLLLLASALPLASIAFFLGGISLAEASGAYLELFLFGMLAASVGLFSSARESRSNYSTVQSYLMVLMGCIFFLPFYLALRFETRGGVVTVGPSAWTNHTTWEFGAFHFFVGAALYIIAFLSLKARHRLRPQASNLNGMAISFIVFYLYCATWFGAIFSQQIAGTSMTGGDTNALITLYFVAHLGALGFFLNPANLESQVEQAAHHSSPFSRPIFWRVFFMLGLTLPGLLAYSSGVKMPTQSTGVALMLLVLYPINVSLAQKLFFPKWQFAWVYFLGLALLQFGPALGLFSPEDSFFRLYFVSPLLTIWASLDKGFPVHTVAYSFCFQVVLFTLFALGNLLKNRRRRA